MNKEFYAIIGPDDEAGNQQYWDVSEWEWTPDFGRATRYHTGHVFFQPPPPGGVCIIKFSEEGRPLGQYDFGTPPSEGVSFGTL